MSKNSFGTSFLIEVIYVFLKILPFTLAFTYLWRCLDLPNASSLCYVDLKCMQNFAVMWPVNRGTLDVTKCNNDVYLLQMTWHFLIAGNIRIYVILLLQWYLFFDLEVVHFKKGQGYIPWQKTTIFKISLCYVLNLNHIIIIS